MDGINAKNVCVPLIWPQSKDGAIVSDGISLKFADQADLYLMIGTVTKAAAVTLEQGTSVSSITTSLSFTNYFSTGFILEYDGASVETPAAAGETATGAGGGIGYVYKDLGNKLICYAFNGTAFVDNEVLTFSGGKTAVVNGTLKNEDIMVPCTATSDTFNISAVANKIYCIPVHGAMLTDGYDCIELNLADADATLMAAWAVMTYNRYIGEPSETFIYD
jgi:hypothetical protein